MMMIPYVTQTNRQPEVSLYGALRTLRRDSLWNSP